MQSTCARVAGGDGQPEEEQCTQAGLKRRAASRRPERRASAVATVDTATTLSLGGRYGLLSCGATREATFNMRLGQLLDQVVGGGGAQHRADARLVGRDDRGEAEAHAR